MAMHGMGPVALLPGGMDLHLDDDLVKNLLSLVSVEAVSVIKGRILHANATLDRWVAEEMGWETIDGHFVWELFPENCSETVRKWYMDSVEDSIVAAVWD